MLRESFNIYIKTTNSKQVRLISGPSNGNKSCVCRSISNSISYHQDSLVGVAEYQLDTKGEGVPILSNVPEGIMSIRIRHILRYGIVEILSRGSWM